MENEIPKLIDEMNLNLSVISNNIDQINSKNNLEINLENILLTGLNL
jgi:hypothetical protein